MYSYLTPTFSYAPMIPSTALGSRVWDIEGNEFIDFAGGIAVNALGHCHPDLIRALETQAQTLWHVSNNYTTTPAQMLAKRLVDNTFADKVFFCNSGAEANEAALKLARKYAHDHFSSEKSEIVSCINSFHGRTLFTVSIGGQPEYSRDFAPLPPGITHVPFNNIHALEQVVNDKTCAVIIEPIQGQGGVLPATTEFVQAARDLCSKHNALLIFDEVQTGMGRTGRLFAYQQYGVVPDILTSAKALGCGFPIGAMLTVDDIANSLGVGTHGSTFGGNPLACAVGCKAFDLINSAETLAHVNRQGQKLTSSLSTLAKESGIFKEIRGAGLLIGCVLADRYAGRAGELVSMALNHGLLLTVAGNDVVRLAPSLLLSDKDLEEGLVCLQHALDDIR